MLLEKTRIVRGRVDVLKQGGSQLNAALTRAVRPAENTSGKRLRCFPFPSYFPRENEKGHANSAWPRRKALWDKVPKYPHGDSNPGYRTENPVS